jgi:hypothetical protein
MVCIPLAVVWIVSLVPYVRDLVLFSAVRTFNAATFICLLALGFFFLRRRYDFLNRSMRTPFAMALPKIKIDLGEPAAITSPTDGVPKVYLAGGFKSGWQDIVKNQLPGMHFFDPRDHCLQATDQYTFWDLEAVRKSDWVLAYLENGNPGGYALCVEVGFGKALKKRIVLIDEKTPNDPGGGRHLGMLRACADVMPLTLDDAIRFMKQVEQGLR